MSRQSALLRGLLERWLATIGPGGIDDAALLDLDYRLLQAQEPLRYQQARRICLLVRSIAKSKKSALDLTILIPERTEPQRVVPHDPRIAFLASALEELSAVVLSAQRKALVALPDHAFLTLCFLVMCVEGAVSPWIALTSIARALHGHRDGHSHSDWLWVFCSPSALVNVTPLYLRPPLKRLVGIAAWKSTHEDCESTTEDDETTPKARKVDDTAPLFPRPNRKDEKVTISDLQSQTSIAIRKALMTPSDFSSVPGLPHLVQRIRAELGKGQPYWPRLEKAARFLWWQRGLAPAFIEMLYAPLQPSAPERPFLKYDGAPGPSPMVLPSTLKRLDERKVKPQERLKVEQVRMQRAEEDQSLDEGSKVYGHSLKVLARDIRSHAEQQKRFKAAQLKGDRWESELPRTRDELVAAWQQTVPTLPDHLLRCLAGWLKSKSTEIRTDKAYAALIDTISDIALHEGAKTSMLQWDAEDVSYLLVNHNAQEHLAATTRRAHSGTLAAFLRFCQISSGGAFLPGLELFVSHSGEDWDFRRRTSIPNPRDVAWLIDRLLKRRPRSKRRRVSTVPYDDVVRHAVLMALMLITLWGLRPAECARLTVAHFDWNPRCPQLYAPGSKSHSARRTLSLLGAECIYPGAFALLKGCWDVITADTLPGAATPLFANSLFGKDAEKLSATTIAILRKEFKYRLGRWRTDLYSMRHYFATARMVQLVDRFVGRVETMQTSTERPDPQSLSDAEQRAVESDRAAAASEVIHLLQDLGHSSIYSLAGHYFHAMDYLRFKLLNPAFVEMLSAPLPPQSGRK